MQAEALLVCSCGMWVAAFCVFMLCLLLSLILIVKCLGVSRFSLHVLLYHMVAVV